MSRPWYAAAYRRNLVDMHIADWDERFLSQFDPAVYVDTVCLARPQAAMVYAHSHAGHCYYPTQVGHMHASLHGRDIFGAVLDRFHERGVSVVAYFSLIYDDQAYRTHSDWRIIRANGQAAAERSRYGVCCPNSPYRDYAAAHVAELCRLYDFQGIYLDMTFWPGVCYCPHCRQRYAAEVGTPLPQIIHWEDPAWVSFQRKREEWLTEFAQHITSTVRQVRPGVSVQHQGSSYLGEWQRGVTEQLATANDFLGGDFYGDALQGSVVRKLFANLSPNLPTEFQTSFNANLRHHTARKSRELLLAKASACLADGAAFFFIDAIDPVGTLNPAVYERMASVFAETESYEPYLGGRLVQDVAIYYSLRSKGDRADNGKPVDDPGLSTRSPHIAAIQNVARALIAAKIPYGVITRANLADLARYPVIVLPDLIALDEEEAAALRAYVRAGGRLYASKHTSLIRADGLRLSDFMLSDVLGVHYLGETQENYTYIAPAAGLEEHLAGYAPNWPLGLDQAQLLIQADAAAQVLGHLVLPYTDPAEPRRFASIHSNPPGIVTGYPAVVQHTYGQGQALYCSGALEASELHRETFIGLLRLLLGPLSVQAEAPKSVELVLRDDTEAQRLIISLVNFQQELPNIPVEGIRVQVRLSSRRPRRLLLLPARTPWPYELEGDGIAFVAPRLETLTMLELGYE